MAVGGDIPDIDDLISEITSTFTINDEASGENILEKEFEMDPNASYIKRRFDRKDKIFCDIREVLVNRTLDYMDVSKVLHDTFLVPMNKIEEDFIVRKNDDSEDSETFDEREISEEEINSLQQLLKTKEEITKQANMILKDNRELEKQLIDQKLELKNSEKKRNDACNEAIKIYKVSGNSSREYDSYDPETSAGIRQNELLKLRYERVRDMASILYRLIAFSGVDWANKKSLLVLILLTGRLINTPFKEYNLRDKGIIKCLEKIMDVIDVSI